MFLPGTVLFLRSIAALDRLLRQEDAVLVHRIRAGQHEITCREVVAGEDGQMLLAYRTKCRDMAALRLPMPVPYHGETWEVDGDRYQIQGLVILHYTARMA